MFWCSCNINVFMSNWSNEEGKRLCVYCVRQLVDSKEKFILYASCPNEPAKTKK